MPDDPVIDALEAAVAADPDQPALRRHLAQVLVGAGRHERAVEHVQHLLAVAPDDLDALRLAATAWRALGDETRAAAFERTAEALGGGAAAPPTAGTASPPSSSPPVEPVPAGGSVPDTADELFAAWDATEALPEPEVGELTTSQITLAQVGGLADVKARLDRSLFAPLRNPELAEAFGAAVRGGVVLYGPPGCGKTYLARAVAGELGARFYAVGIADVLDMWMGNSERNLARLFEVARAHAPCVLFFDEIDALGMRRTNLRNSPSLRNVVNQLLAELDGVGSDNRGVFLLAATNHPWDIDPALLRPGRLGHLLFVPPPDREARAHILWHQLADRPRGELDVWAIADRTEGFSGADLRAVVDGAVELALAASLETGGVVPVDMGHLAASLSGSRPSVGSWVEVARNVVTYSNTEGQYDELAAWLKHGRR